MSHMAIDLGDPGRALAAVLLAVSVSACNGTDDPVTDTERPDESDQAASDGESEPTIFTGIPALLDDVQPSVVAVRHRCR